MVNKVILLGNVGKDPEIRATNNQTKVANFSLATSEVYKDKNGERQSKTEWHNIVIWGKLSEIVEKHVNKGDKLYLEGKITTNKWQDKDGNDRSSIEIVCDKMQMLGSKQESNGQNSQSRQSGGDDLPY